MQCNRGRILTKEIRYVYIYISREISIEQPSVGLASLAQLPILNILPVLFFHKRSVRYSMIFHSCYLTLYSACAFPVSIGYITHYTRFM